MTETIDETMRIVAETIDEKLMDELFKSFIEGSQTGFYAVKEADGKTSLVYANRGLLNMLGYESLDELARSKSLDELAGSNHPTELSGENEPVYIDLTHKSGHPVPVKVFQRSLTDGMTSGEVYLNGGGNGTQTELGEENLLAICCYCKSMRNDEGEFVPPDKVLTRRYGILMTHGICPPCFEKEVEDLMETEDPLYKQL